MATKNLGKLYFTNKGAYSSTTSYIKDEIVSYDGNNYIALQNTTGNLPTTLAPNWGLVSKGYNNFVSAITQPTSQGNALPSIEPADRVAKLPILQAQGGHNKTLFLMQDGSIKSVGRSLGNANGDIVNRVRANTISCNATFVEVFDGGLSSYGLDTNGDVWAWGYNNRGQLGLGNTVDRIIPEKISFPGGAKISKVFPMDGTCDNPTLEPCCFFLSITGKVFATGANVFGQLGLGTTTAVSIPTQLTDTSTLVGGFASLIITDLYVASYPTSVYAITNTGVLYAWGCNKDGPLGIGNTVNQSKPVLTTLTDVKKVICSTGRNNELNTDYLSTIALKNDGTVWSTGYNGYGQLGTGNTTDRTIWGQITLGLSGLNITDILMIGSPYASSYAITNDNKLYAWGYNGYGSLGTGNSTQQNIPINISSLNGKVLQVKGSGNRSHNTAYVLTNDGKIYASGNNWYSQLGRGFYGLKGTDTYYFIPMMNINGTVVDFRAYTTNQDRSYINILLADGRVLACGYNEYGGCGTGTASNRQMTLSDVLF